MDATTRQRRSERTRRANHIRGLIAFIGSIPETALPFWRDDVLYVKVRQLVRLVRDEWHWVDEA